MKKYRSLSDVYGDVAFNKVPKPPTHRVLGEDVEILAHHLGEPEKDVEHLGVIDDKYYSKLRRDVIARGVGGYEDAVRKILEDSGWEVGAGVDAEVVKQVVDIFAKYDVDSDTVKKLQRKKAENSLGTLEGKLQNTKPWNLTDSFDTEASNLTPQWGKLVCELMRVTAGSDNATVAVGPGEVAATLFTNAVKGEKGDLLLQGYGEIEMKADGGRLGSSNYTHNFPVFSKDFLDKKGIDMNTLYVNKLIKALKVNITKAKASIANGAKWIAKLNPVEEVDPNEVGRTSIPVPLPTPEQPDIINDPQNGILSILDSIETTIDNDQANIDHNIQELGAHVDTLIAAKGNEPASTKAFVNSTYAGNDLLSGEELSASKMGQLDIVVYLTNKIKNVRATPLDQNWQNSTQYMFNIDHGLSAGELAQAFIEMRSDVLDPAAAQQLLLGAVKILTPLAKAGSDLFSDKKGQVGNKTVPTTVGQLTLQKLQAALQMTGYQTHHQFPYLLIVNPTSGQCVTIQFGKSNNLGDKLVTVYKQLVGNPEIHIPNAGVDDRNKGIGIAIGTKGAKGACGL